MYIEELRKELSNLLMLPIEQVTNDLSLSALGQWDSFTVVSLMGAITQHFNLVVSAEELMQCQSIGNIFNLIETKKVAS